MEELNIKDDIDLLHNKLERKKSEIHFSDVKAMSYSRNRSKSSSSIRR